MATDDPTPTEFESDLEALAAEVYKARAQSPTEVTPERWASIKELFPVSARSCLSQAREIQEEEL